MKKYWLIISLCCISLSWMGCEKSNMSEPQLQKKGKLILKSASETEIVTPESQAQFSIPFAGIFGEDLSMTFEYKSSQFHDFVVTWDGEIHKENTKEIICLKVAQQKSENTPGTLITDSLCAKLKDLGLTKDLCKNPNITYKVINTSNPDNTLSFQVKNGGGWATPNSSETWEEKTQTTPITENTQPAITPNAPENNNPIDSTLYKQ